MQISQNCWITSICVFWNISHQQQSYNTGSGQNAHKPGQKFTIYSMFYFQIYNNNLEFYKCVPAETSALFSANIKKREDISAKACL